MAALRPAALEVARVVTAFTAAHSITLCLAALGLVSLPSRWVESAIAASVVLAALNNLWPLVDGRRWAVAFGFGLVHGFGFASVLADLGLPSDALATALVGFNLGVELGQLAIVAAFLPLAFVLRGTLAYRRVAFPLGSLAIAGVALVWLVERARRAHDLASARGLDRASSARPSATESAAGTSQAAGVCAPPALKPGIGSQSFAASAPSPAPTTSIWSSSTPGRIEPDARRSAAEQEAVEERLRCRG